MFSRSYYIAATVILIFLSIFSLTLKVLYPELLIDYFTYFKFLDFSISLLFLLDFLLRIVFSDNKKGYLFSINGCIDFFASIPFFFFFFIGIPIDSAWARLFRLLSLFRALKGYRLTINSNGIVGKILPYALLALGLKILILVLESFEWWTVGTQFNMVLGVVGFSLAVLMGSKLTTVNSRLFTLEDTICRIVGSMRDMWSIKDARADIIKWSIALENFLKAEFHDRLTQANKLRSLTDELEEVFEEHNIGGPNSAGFHRDAAFLIHRATIKTPKAYDNFLKTITIVYIVTLIIGIQGGMGIIAAFLSTIVLGGVYFLIEDLDDPLGNNDQSFIDARLDALEYWNNAKSR